MAGWFDFLFPAGDPVYGHDPDLSKKVARAPSDLLNLLAPRGNPDLQVQHKTRAEKEYADFLQQRAQAQQQLSADRGTPTTPSGAPISRAEAEAGIPYLARAFAAQQGLMAADQSRAAAAPRRSYPIDAYGSTPQERIRTVQNLNAQESQGEAITEQAGPPMDMLATAMNYGVPSYAIGDMEAFHSRPRYELSPDLGPQQAHADAQMAHAANERARMEAIQKQVQAEQAAAAQQQPFNNYVNAAKAYEATGDHPVSQEVMQRAAAQYLEQQKLMEQQMQQQQMQQQIRQQMRSRMPQMPVLGRHMTLQEMIQYGMV